MKIITITLIAFAYIFIGFWVAYILYKWVDNDLVEDTIINILFWPAITFFVLIVQLFFFLDKSCSNSSQKIEQFFDLISKKKKH